MTEPTVLMDFFHTIVRYWIYHNPECERQAFTHARIKDEI